LGVTTLLALGACADIPVPMPGAPAPRAAAIDPVAVAERVTWGIDQAAFGRIKNAGVDRFIEYELQPDPRTPLPAEVQAQIASMRISQQTMFEIVTSLEQHRRESNALKDPDARKAGQQAYQAELNQLADEATQRSLLRELYSGKQLQEQLAWFWTNHFSIFRGKANLRAMVGDYDENAIRPHVLGHFRDLLAATVFHPAMLRYLDNEQNAAGRINENYARELMELHTLGVSGGYTQADVQELARILTGLGVNQSDKTPPVKPELRSQYVRRGLFEFNPNRHDYGQKHFLGRTIAGRGLAEVDEVIDILSRHPATARFVSRKLATYFVADDPSPALLERMASTFVATDGDIASTLRVMFHSPEFAASLGRKFKDPAHYVISALRVAYPTKVITNAAPVVTWLRRLGEPSFGRQTPDGYSPEQSAWASAGQMTARFEIARIIGSGSARLFKTDWPESGESDAFPQLTNTVYLEAFDRRLAPATRHALDEARSPEEWNAFLLASPEFMYR